MDWLLSAIAITGNIFVGKKKFIGWVILFIGNWLWLYYIISIQQWGLLLSDIFNIIVSFWFAYKWYKEYKDTRKITL